MDQNNQNIEKPPVSIKHSFKTIIILLVVLIIITISSLTLRKDTKEIKIDPVGSSLQVPIITSEEITNSVSPNDNDKFWAAMYRQDYVINKIYFVIDRNKNLLREVIGANADTFDVLSSNDGSKFSYAKDKNGIYCNDVLRSDISTTTFTFNKWSVLYAKDKDHVYLNCDILVGADPETFTQLEDQGFESKYAKDKDRVYFNGIVLSGANPDSFKIIRRDGYSFDSTHLYLNDKLVGGMGYKIDASSTGKIFLTGYADATTIFKGENYAHIMENIKVSSKEGSNALLVHGQKIYYIDTYGNLKFFDVATNLTNTIHFPELPSLDDKGLPKIVDLFIEADTLYLLYGENCNQYRRRCDLDLLRYNTKNSTLEKILSHSKARSITGFDKENNNIYLKWAEGDAGCSWSTTYVVNIDSNVASEYQISGCSGEDSGRKEYQEVSVELDNLNIKIKDDISYSDAVYIENGKIVPNRENNQGGNSVRYFNQ